jgi:hypothetical protein
VLRAEGDLPVQALHGRSAPADRPGLARPLLPAPRVRPADHCRGRAVGAAERGVPHAARPRLLHGAPAPAGDTRRARGRARSARRRGDRRAAASGDPRLARVLRHARRRHDRRVPRGALRRRARPPADGCRAGAARGTDARRDRAAGADEPGGAGSDDPGRVPGLPRASTDRR